MSKYYTVRLTAKEVDTILNATALLSVELDDHLESDYATREDVETDKAIGRVRSKMFEATG